MNDEKITELIIKISTELASLNSMMKSALEKLSNHEARITNLETDKTGFKDKIVKYLCIALISSLAVIATLTGSTAILTRIFGGIENVQETNSSLCQKQNN